MRSYARRGEVLRQRGADLEDGPAAIGTESHPLGDGAFVAGRERGRVPGERVVGIGIEQAAPGKHAKRARVDIEQERLDLLLRRRGRAGVDERRHVALLGRHLGERRAPLGDQAVERGLGGIARRVCTRRWLVS
jgi:hypothetical protein